MGLLFQMFSVLRCGDVDQAAHAARQRLAAQVGHAVLGDDQAGIARGVLTGPPSRARCGCVLAVEGRARMGRPPAAGSTAQKVHGAADGAHIDAASHLGIDLTGQIHFNGGIDGTSLSMAARTSGWWV
jgi:hypothetical protein